MTEPLGKLYLVKAQCHASSLVSKIKVVERCFSEGHTVEFVMHDVAPKEGPPLPYFLVKDVVMGEENEAVQYLATAGAEHLVHAAGVSKEHVKAVIASLEGGIAQAVKTATKSKDLEAMTANKAKLLEALAPLEQLLCDRNFMGGSAFSVADVVAMVDLRAAFEKVLDADDRIKIPLLSKWYAECYEQQPAVQKVWGGKLVLCEETELPVAKKKDKEAMKAEKKEKEKAKKADSKAASAGTKSEGGKEVKKETKLGISSLKDEDFGAWYANVVTEAELISYYAVSGCYILRPWAFCMWEFVTRWFDDKIKSIGVQNCMFPLFITEDVLNKEQDHVEDFAPEVAWVTRSGKSELDRPLAIRPTSETAMYPYFADWIRSHRDLPLKLNQWTNVVRWEFKHPTPFIRSREFLWQEGHTAHETLDGAMAEVHQILQWYRGIYEELLAVPVVPGWKTEKEKFAGAYKTLTVEAFIPATGKGVQGATSHCLGQNFSKMFDIQYETRAGGKDYVWQNSWGCTTRSLGVMIMTHGDDKGLVLPPRVAAKQVVVIPIPNKTMSDEAEAALYARAEEIEQELAAAGIRATSDLRVNYTPGWKYNHWELKGVPIRLELGPKDMEKEAVVAACRHDGSKVPIAWKDLATRVPALLEEIQAAMLAKATEKFNACKDTAYDMESFKCALDKKHMVLAPWADEKGIEDQVKEQTVKKASDMKAAGGPEAGGEGGEAGAKALCIPLEQPEMPPGTKCFFTGKPAKNFCLWGRSY